MRKNLGRAALSIGIRGGVTAAVLVTFLTLTGCADVVTYARRSNAEGMRLYRDGIYNDAAGAFRNAIRQDPRDYHSHFYLAVCYDEMRQHQQALQSYYTAREIMATTQEGKFDDQFRQQVLDALASSVARFDEREVELNRIEEEARRNPSAENWFLVGKIYRLKGDADLAVDAYRRAAKFEGDNFFIRKEAGLYLLDPLNQPQEAKYYLLQAHRLNPNDPAVNNGLYKLGVTPQPAYQEQHIPIAPLAPRNSVQPVYAPVNKRVPGPNPYNTANLPRD